MFLYKSKLQSTLSSPKLVLMTVLSQPDYDISVYSFGFVVICLLSISLSKHFKSKKIFHQCVLGSRGPPGTQGIKGDRGVEGRISKIELSLCYFLFHISICILQGSEAVRIRRSARGSGGTHLLYQILTHPESSET